MRETLEEQLYDACDNNDIERLGKILSTGVDINWKNPQNVLIYCLIFI